MSVGQMLDYFAEHGLPTDATHVTRDHLETFLADFAKDHKPATVQTRYKCLRLFFSFLLEENEISQHPMGNMKPPLIPATQVSILEKPQLEALLRTAEGRDFDERRDAAILRLFVDTGMRRGEMAGLTIGDIELEQELAHVSNGNRSRACPFGPKTARALDRYLRAGAALRCKIGLALARQEGPALGQWNASDGAPTRAQAGIGAYILTSYGIVSRTHGSPTVAGGRSHAACRLALPKNSPKVCSLGSRRASA